MKLNIDFRLIEIQFDVHALREHFNIIDKNIVDLIEHEKRCIEELYKDNPGSDQNDLAAELQVHYHNIEIMYPRVFWAPFIVSCHSIFEASVSQIAHELMKKKNYGLKLDDLKGSLLEKIEKYFNRGLDFKIFVNSGHKEKIQDLIFVRNVIAHTNGRVELLDEGKINKLQELEKSDSGISELMNQIVVERKFAFECLEAVEMFLSDLCQRYKSFDDQNT